MPDKEKKEKEVDQFRVGEVKDVGAGEDVLFQYTGTTIQMFKFGFELLFSSLQYINTGLDLHYLHLLILFFLLVLMVRVCAISFYVCMQLA